MASWHMRPLRVWVLGLEVHQRLRNSHETPKHRFAVAAEHGGADDMPRVQAVSKFGRPAFQWRVISLQRASPRASRGLVGFGFFQS